MFSPELSLNTWYYVVGVNDGSESKLYIDGEFVGGCDVMTSLYQSGELEDMLKDE